MNTAPYITMPKACASCIHYQPVGFDEDEHCPFPKASALSPKPTRTPYGDCRIHQAEAFATEICNSYEVEPFVIATDVPNRPVPRQPRQERLTLEQTA